MTTPTALRELADRFKDVIDTNMMDGTARRTLHKLVDELRAAASEGGESHTIPELMELADGVVIANATGNEKLFIEAVQKLVAGVREHNQLHAGLAEDPFLYVREIDAGTDNACWVVGNAVDPGAMPLYTNPPEVARDAGRYRFLRNDPPLTMCVRIDRDGCKAIYTDGDELDTAVDAAISGAAGVG